MDRNIQSFKNTKRSKLSFGRATALCFAVFFILAGIGMRYMQKANDENALRLAEEGKTALATITGKHIDTSSSANRTIANKQTGGASRYVLEYSFPLADGGEWQGDDEVSEEEYNTVNVGDQYDVRYWTKNPDIATILEGAYASGAQLAKTISIVLFALAALMIIILLIRPLRNALNR